MTMTTRSRTVAAIKVVRSAFGAPGDYGYETPQGRALAGLYDVYNELVAKALIAKNPGEADGTLEARLAECLASAIDTPLLSLRDIGGGNHPILIRIGSFNSEIAEQACELLEEAGL